MVVSRLVAVRFGRIAAVLMVRGVPFGVDEVNGGGQRERWRRGRESVRHGCESFGLGSGAGFGSRRDLVAGDPDDD
jgi:hypothetical protein